MKTLVFDQLVIDVTRRCNLSCAMCFRGEAENVDVPLPAIDTIAQQAARVNAVVFNGGEPLLNLRAIRHTLDVFRENGVVVRTIAIKTNGVLQNVDVTQLVKDWAEYIRPEWGYDDLARINISISGDRYHIQAGADPKAAVEYFNREVGDCANIRVVTTGDRPFKMGRAKGLVEAKPIPPVMGHPRKISVWENGKKPPACPALDQFNEDHPSNGETLIMCPLRVTARGLLTTQVTIGGEFAAEDVHIKEIFICDLTAPTDILAAIRAWNEKPLPDCKKEIFDEYVEMMQDHIMTMPRAEQEKLAQLGGVLKQLMKNPIGNAIIGIMLMGLYMGRNGNE